MAFIVEREFVFFLLILHWKSINLAEFLLVCHVFMVAKEGQENATASMQQQKILMQQKATTAESKTQKTRCNNTKPQH